LTGGKKNACTGHFHGSSIRQLSTAEADGQGIRLSPAGAFGPRVERLHASQLQSTIDPHDGSGNTPLHLAAQFNNTKSARTLLENWRCSCDVRNWRGVMSKNMGLWHKETQQLFDDYYYIVDRKLKKQNDAQNWKLKIDMER
jgi:hypothetical protein